MKYTPWPKRDPVKNYFQLPNEIFLLGLSPGALAVYSYLLCCENRQTYQCWPSYKTIGNAVRMSANTVRKYVCELEERQLISTENTTVTTRDGLKRNGTCSTPSSRSSWPSTSSTNSSWRRWMWRLNVSESQRHSLSAGISAAQRDGLCAAV